MDYGARPMRRALEQRVEDPLAEEILRGTFEGNNTIVVDTVKNEAGKVTRLDFRGETRQKEAEAVAVASGETH